jgi:putative ABC transport system ATP-binding protein
MPLLVAEQLGKTYAAGESQVAALTDVSLTVSAGEFVAITGPSGCGKSTLLHLCGAMDRPSSGRLTLDGERLDTMSEEALTLLRRGRVGFVFQFFNLLQTLTLGENIALPLLLAGTSPRDAMSRGAAFAERVGVAHRLDHLPAQLSGGEMQRAAIARALVHSPILLVADEPTGNLDSANGTRVLELLQTLNRESGVTVLLATHAREIAAAADRTISLCDGRIDDASSMGSDAVKRVALTASDPPRERHRAAL